jgi:dihydrofolate reductase
MRKLTAAMKLSLDGRSDGPRAGKDIYRMGGASLVGRMLDAGLVDEIHCTVYPLLVGQAKGPFDRLKRRRELKLLGQRQIGEG